jgi:anti-sigma B factor antagonist
VTVMPAEFSLSYEEIGDGGMALITVGGELDLESVSRFEEALERATAKGGPLVLDMTELRFMDSTGLRSLLLTSERFASEGRPTAVAVASRSAVRYLFWVAGVEDRLSLFPTADEAVTFVAGGKA